MNVSKLVLGRVERPARCPWPRASAARFGFGSAITTVDGADGVGVQRRQDADRAGAGDQHDVAAADAGPVDAVGRDAGRLDDGTLDVGDLVGQRRHLVVLEHGVLGESAGLGD